MSWFRPKTRPDAVDPNQIRKLAEASLTKTAEQEEHVSRLNAYLIRRKNQNGFGDDFEYTLKPKGAN